MPLTSRQVTPGTSANTSGEVLLAASPTCEIRIRDSIEGFCAPPPAATVCPRIADRCLRMTDEIAQALSVPVIHRGPPLLTRPSLGFPRGARLRRPHPRRDPGDPPGRASARARLRGSVGRLASVGPSRDGPTPVGSRHGQLNQRPASRTARSVGRCASGRCETGGRSPDGDDPVAAHSTIHVETGLETSGPPSLRSPGCVWRVRAPSGPVSYTHLTLP